MTVALWLTLGLFMFCGFPIAFAMGGISILMLLVEGTVTPIAIAQKMVYAVDSFPLMAVPFFILAGDIMNESGVTDRIFGFAKKLVGHMHGGLGQVNVLASVITAGMSGSAVSDVAGLGRVEIKAMTEEGYDTPFSAAITAATAIIGPIIPPSIPMVLYGSIVGISVMRLLMGGIGPGVLMSAALMVIVYVISKRRNYPRSQRATLKEIGISFIKSFPAIMMPVILLGSILLGFMTPTEGACFACLYAIFLGLFVYKGLTLKSLWAILKRTSSFMATTLIIIGMSGVMGLVLTQQMIPQKMLMFFTALTENKYVILFLINILLLILGCLMESAAIIVVLAPLLANVAIAFGIDPIHFGVMVVFNLMLANITPPVGMVLFISCKISGLKTAVLVKELVPFLIVLFIVLLLITYIPGFITFVPNLLMGPA